VERKRGANRGEFVVVLWWLRGGMHGKTASIFGDEKHANFLGFIFRAVVLTDGPTALAYPTNVDLFAGVPVRAVTS
jgi:hypothetical protein